MFNRFKRTGKVALHIRFRQRIVEVAGSGVLRFVVPAPESDINATTGQLAGRERLTDDVTRLQACQNFAVAVNALSHVYYFIMLDAIMFNIITT